MPELQDHVDVQKRRMDDVTTRHPKQKHAKKKNIAQAHDEEDDSVQVLTVPEFKVLLRNSASTFLAFQRFNTDVQSFQAKTLKQQNKTYDVMSEYFKSSPECTEILDVLTADKDIYYKSESIHMLTTLNLILTTLLNESSKKKFPQVAENMCRVLAERGNLTKIYSLIITAKGKVGETALCVLRRASEHGPLVTRLVHSSLTFLKEDVQQLLTEQNASRLRQDFVKLLITMVKHSSAVTLKALIDEKGLLNGCFAKLHMDPPELIEFTLTTFDAKVLSNPSITKTQRTRLFNETTIPQLLECYITAKSNRKLKKVVCEFVTVLLSDQKRGITFSDPNFGNGERNMNHLVSLVLSKSVLRSAYMDSMLEDVVFSCLHSRPDQIQRYLSVLEDSDLSIKNDKTWREAATHVTKLMYSLPPLERYVTEPEKLSNDMLAKIAMTLTSPPPSTLKIFKHVLSISDMAMQYTSLGLLLVIFNRAKAVLGYLNPLMNGEKYEGFKKSFIDDLIKYMPHVDLITQCWTLVNRTVKMNAKTSYSDVTSFACRVLDLLILYLELSPSTVYQSSMSINVPAILQDVENLSTELADVPEVANLKGGNLTVKALQLLGEMGEEAGLAVMKTKKDQNVLSMILKLMYCGDTDDDDDTELEARSVLTTQLKKTGWFVSLDPELEIWFCNGNKLQSTAFIERLIQTLLSNPYPYYDQIQTLIERARDEKKYNQAIDRKLLPFSPMVIIALQLYGTCDFKDQEDVKDYLETCLSALLLRQDDPLPLCILLADGQIQGLSKVAQVLLGRTKFQVEDCGLKPLEDLWRLLFGFNKDIRSEKYMGICDSMVSTMKEEVVSLYAVLALWHCESEDKALLCEIIVELLSKLPDRLIPTRIVLQSGVCHRWYLCSHEQKSINTRAITDMCHRLIDSIPTIDQLTLLSPITQTLTSCCREAVMAIDEYTDDGYIKLVLQSTHRLCQFYSATDLLNIVTRLLDFDSGPLGNEEVDYFECIYKCVSALYQLSPKDEREMKARVLLINRIVCINTRRDTCGYKYKILDNVTISFETYPYSLWTECLRQRSSDLSHEAATHLLVRCITEATSEHLITKLTEACCQLDNEVQMTKLPIVQAVLTRRSNDSDTAKQLSSLWAPTTSSLTQSIASGDFDGFDRIGTIIVIQHLAPAVKSKKVERLLSTVIDSPQILTDKSLMSLCVTLMEVIPERLCHLLYIIIDQVSELSTEVVDNLATSLPTHLMLSEASEQFQEFVKGKWRAFIFAALRKNYESVPWLTLVSQLCCLVYSPSQNCQLIDLSAAQLFSLIISHSKFFKVMVNKEQAHKSHPSKGILLTLLTQLVKLSPSVCESDHFALWLSSYQATMCHSDQQLLYIMYLYELHGISTIKLRPYLWGSAGVGHYSLKSNLAISLSSQPTIDSVIECLDRDLLHKSAYNLPLDKQLSPNDIVTTKEKLQDEEDLYDPAFLLPLFAYIMRPDNTLNIRLMIESGIITYTLCCLSSHHAHSRSAARFILHEFRSHLESSHYSDTIQGLYVLDLLKESIPRENSRIPPIIAIFLSKTLQLIPDEHMYRVCHNYILIKPTMDIELVPEFYRLFYSSSPQFSVERSWLLELLMLGLRGEDDSKLYEKLKIIPIIMSYSQCSLCSKKDKGLIISIMDRLCHQPTSSQLAIKYNVIAWITNMVLSFPESISQILRCTQGLVSTLYSREQRCIKVLIQIKSTLLSILPTSRLTDEQQNVVAGILIQCLAYIRDEENPGHNKLSPGDCELIITHLAQSCHHTKHNTIIKYLTDAYIC